MGSFSLGMLKKPERLKKLKKLNAFTAFSAS
jgi:hypothetical protein